VEESREEKRKEKQLGKRSDPTTAAGKRRNDKGGGKREKVTIRKGILAEKRSDYNKRKLSGGIGGGARKTEPQEKSYMPSLEISDTPRRGYRLGDKKGGLCGGGEGFCGRGTGGTRRGTMTGSSVMASTGSVIWRGGAPLKVRPRVGPSGEGYCSKKPLRGDKTGKERERREKKGGRAGEEESNHATPNRYHKGCQRK